MPTEAITLLLSQGPMGLVAGLFLWLYLSERKRATDTTRKAEEENRLQREKHYEQLDGVRKSQIAREQEISGTLEQYGRSCIAAVEQTTFLAQELRRIHDRER
jgi:hypothetical protein